MEKEDARKLSPAETPRSNMPHEYICGPDLQYIYWIDHVGISSYL